jgi:hypothetical protein
MKEIQYIAHERHEIQNRKTAPFLSLSLSSFHTNKREKEDHAKLQNKLATRPTDQPA